MTLLLEYWKPVVGYELLYEISNTGRVYSHYSGRELSPILASSGYYQVSLSKDGAKKKLLVHDLVCRTFNGPRPIGLIINHCNGHKRTNRPSNLEYVTYAGNAQHAVRLGINNRGEKNGKARLDEAKVRFIRASAELYTPEAQARLLGVHATTIHRVLEGISWRHVTSSG